MVNIYSARSFKIRIKIKKAWIKKNLEQKFEVDQNDRFTLLEFPKKSKSSLRLFHFMAFNGIKQNKQITR